MKSTSILFALALGASTCLLTAQDNNTPPEGKRPPSHESGPEQGRGGPHLLPPHAMEQLSLTADQQKQLGDLEAEVKAKIGQILTPAQLEQLKQMHPPQHQGKPGGCSGGARPTPPPAQ